MNKNAIKKYAVWARRELIDRVSKKALRYGISPHGDAAPDVDSVDGRLLSRTEKKQRRALIEKVAAHGYAQTMEEVAYTWFNRFTALRFMEVSGYLPSHVRVFTNEAGEFRPQILTEAIHLDLQEADMDRIYALKEANDEEALFRYLIIVQCDALNEILPGMFQRLEDYTALLLPDNLLREGSVIARLVTQGDADSIPEEDWRDQVQIIGWLYQYYNTEPKDKVFAALKKNIKVAKEKIPAATQLFTPDWIVRYMVENSLGRLWLEGHPSDTLQSAWTYYLPEAEQEETVRTQLAAMRKERANRRPEDIRCIDPCMGSGHILCYMFDVLMRIYEDYGYTARDAAASIVQNNLYGLDIDERAAQLAYFAVMMKARQYDRRFFSRGIQPNVMAIEESNGLTTWTETAGDSLAFGQLTFEDDFIRMVDDLIEIFQDAKEYGSLLTVQPERYDALVDFIENAKQEAGNLLFRAWVDEVDQRILPLIRQATWLAAKYDIVVTNPPYMGSSNMSATLSAFVKKKYPDSKSDLFAAFIERCGDFARTDGYEALVTQHAWMFLSSYEKLRAKLLQKEIMSMTHLGARAFEEIGGEVVQTTAFVLTNQHTDGYAGTYARLVNANTQDAKEELYLSGAERYIARQENFEKIPGMPIAYWVSDNSFSIFENNNTFCKFAETRAGMITGNNDIFVRLWFEVSNIKSYYNCESRQNAASSGKKWFSYSKGGAYRKWYGNHDCVVNWYNDGYDMMHREDSNGNIPAHAFNLEYIFKKNICWNSLSSKMFSARYTEKGFLYDAGGSFASIYDDRELFFLALLNSSVAFYWLTALNPTMNFQKGNIGNIPVIMDGTQLSQIEKLTKENISISRADWDAFETSWDFESHPLVPMAYERREQLSYGIHSAERKKAVTLLAERYRYWEWDCSYRFSKLKENEEELNRIFIDIYGLAEELTPEVEDRDVTVRRIFDTREEIPASMKGSNYAITKADAAKSLISYAVGCMFGRYSLDTPGLAYAGGAWDASKYKTFVPDEDGIIPISDNEYFDDDIVGRFVAFIAAAFGAETVEENLQFIADALGGRGSARAVIRGYFLTGFYADHVKTYQKRPIYWLFDSGKKNGFKCLIYMHRYRPDMLARIRTDYVHEQQSRYYTALEHLTDERDAAATAAEQVRLGKKRAAVEAQAEELRAYEEQIHHLADQMIAIDLDDGVKHNYAIFQDILAKMK